MKTYIDNPPSVGELNTKILDCQLLIPGEYVGRVVDRQPGDRITSYLTVSSGNGVHLEAVADELIEGIRPGMQVAFTINKTAGLSLISNAGLFAVRGPDGKRMTDYGSVRTAVDFIRASSIPVEKIGIISIKMIGA